MEGSYFYFFSWCGWIIATFLMKKDQVRLLTVLSILCVVAGSRTIIEIGPFHISLSYFIMVCICFVGISQYSLWQKLYTVCGTAIIAMLYAAFHMIELYDPIWIVINRVWLLSIIVACVSLFLVRQHMLQLFVMCMGTAQGEALVAIILRQYGFHNEIGEASFLDVLACSVVLICATHLIYKGVIYMEPLKQRYVREGQG